MLPRFDAYGALVDAGLNARFEAVGGEGDEAELERIAELRDLGSQLKDYNIDILNDDETDLNLPTTVALNAFVAVVASVLFTAAWNLGGDLGAMAGQSTLGAFDAFSGV